VFFPLLKTIVHDIEDYDLPMFGAFHNCACIKIKKAYPLQGRRLMHSVWGAGQMAWTKCVIVVDDDVDVHDTMAVMRRVGEACHPTRDVEFARGPVDILDHAAPHVGASMKMGLDATRKKGDAELHQGADALPALAAVRGEAARAAERTIASLPGVHEVRILDSADALAGWWCFVKVQKRAAGDGRAVIDALLTQADVLNLPAWTIVVGDDADVTNADDVFFHWLAQGAFERDRVASTCGRRVIFDATAKVPGDERNGYPVRAWPPILRMRQDVAKKVAERWTEYGIK
jgi:4-hydroxy-3-polyprenylbenzoate decarboxylase